MVTSQMYKELAPYIYPKRRAVEQTIVTKQRSGEELRNAAIQELMESGLSRQQAENIADGKQVNMGIEETDSEVRH